MTGSSDRHSCFRLLDRTSPPGLWVSRPEGRRRRVESARHDQFHGFFYTDIDCRHFALRNEKKIPGGRIRRRGHVHMHKRFWAKSCMSPFVTPVTKAKA